MNLSLSFMKKRGITFKDIVNLYTTGMTAEQQQEWTWKNAPVFEVLLDVVIKHLPNPMQAQKYRITHIWKGDLDTQFGRELAAGRLFSGTIKEGQTVWLNQAKMNQRVAQVFMYRGIKPEQIGEVVAGNVLALGGISGFAGEAITMEPEHPFEDLKHIFEPVITKSIEPTKPSDLPKLVEILRKVSKEDPSVRIVINPETGENLMSGMGELHLEIIENRITTERGLQIKTGEPIVVYRETSLKKSNEMEGKSPNKHNKFYITTQPLPPEYAQAIKDGTMPNGRIKKDSMEMS